MLVKAEITDTEKGRQSMWVFDMDDKNARYDFARRADAALRRGLVVTTSRTETVDITDSTGDAQKLRLVNNLLLALGIIACLAITLLLVVWP